ncbi:metallophosphoesterase family protein [Streptomyces sp. NPDC006333]|uniref:metallophosphoesterase family protein n=1 Tax=Streptomyces sp. NPDC006333 TaxID=3156753 RepID=UPI0033BA800F
MPLRAKRLPDELLAMAERADAVIHAGDWVDAATLDLLEGRARRLIGMYGSNDGPELRERLPEVAMAELGGLRLLNPGSPTDRRRQPYRTCMTLVAVDGVLDELTLHRLPGPGRLPRPADGP